MITLLTGGARSGKSAYALEQLKDMEDVAFIATADSKDADLRERIRRHQSERPAEWHTIETSRAVVVALRTTHHQAYILDCLTMLVANLIQDAALKDGSDAFEANQAQTEAAILESVELLLDGMRENGGDFYIVTNEVGNGTVPQTAQERLFRDVLGKANQIAAEAADNVALLVCGLPVWVKRTSAP